MWESIHYEHLSSSSPFFCYQALWLIFTPSLSASFDFHFLSLSQHIFLTSSLLSFFPHLCLIYILPSPSLSLPISMPVLSLSLVTVVYPPSKTFFSFGHYTLFCISNTPSCCLVSVHYLPKDTFYKRLCFMCVKEKVCYVYHLRFLDASSLHVHLMQIFLFLTWGKITSIEWNPCKTFSYNSKGRKIHCEIGASLTECFQF